MESVRAYAFDAYGTVFDVHAAIHRYRVAIGPEAEAFSALWRVKQLEYSWTRTLMGHYRDFWHLTGDALDFCFARFPAVPRDLRPALLEAYFALEAFSDARVAVDKVKASGRRAVIFTNGTRAMAEAAVRSAGLATLFDDIVSVDDIGRFKTVPETYRLVHQRLGLETGTVALVSSNRWDVAGATAFGMPAIWVNRAGLPDEYVDLPPVRVIGSLAAL